MALWGAGSLGFYPNRGPSGRIDCIRSAPDSEVLAAGRDGIPPLPSSNRAEQPEIATPPQWQVLVDRYRNIFVRGRQVATIEGISSMRWVSRRDLGKTVA
jgi:hypothetical protein